MGSLKGESLRDSPVGSSLYLEGKYIDRSLENPVILNVQGLRLKR